MKHDSSKAIHTSVNQLVSAVTSLVSAVGAAAADVAEGAAERASATARAFGGAALAAPAALAQRSQRLKKAIKAHWDSMTPGERKARIKKMLAARGLKPKP